MNLDPCFTLHIQSNLKWITNLIVRAKIVQPLEENLGINHHDLGLGNGFLDLTPTETKEKNKLDVLKIQNFHASKDTIKRVKRQPTKWEEIFTNNVFDKGL